MKTIYNPQEGAKIIDFVIRKGLTISLDIGKNITLDDKDADILLKVYKFLQVLSTGNNNKINTIEVADEKIKEKVIKKTTNIDKDFKRLDFIQADENNNKTYVCTTCGDKFKYLIALLGHKRKHK